MEDMYEAFDMRTGEVHFTGTEDEVNEYIERCEAEDEVYNPDGLDDCIEYGIRRNGKVQFIKDDSLSELTDIAVMSWFFGISPKEVMSLEWKEDDLTRANDYYDQKLYAGKVSGGKAFVNEVYSYWHDITIYPQEEIEMEKGE